MLALHVTLLTDRYAATSYNDRAVPEWPPHPARLYSALVEALHSDDTVDVDEAAALDALASAGAPTVIASEAFTRRVMTVYVPVNDTDVVGGNFDAQVEAVKLAAAAVDQARAEVRSAGPRAAAAERALAKAEAVLAKAEAALRKRLIEAAQPGSRGGTAEDAAKLLPWGRTRQPRTFPTALPHDPRVSFVWPDAAPGLAAPLEQVAARVVRLGHSASFVHVGVEASEAGWSPLADDPRQIWRPDANGDLPLRVPQPGQRADLEAGFLRHFGDAPGRVMPAIVQRYAGADRAPAAATTHLTGGRWVVYELVSDLRPPAHVAVALAEAVRGAVLRFATDPIHPLLSGHAAHGPLDAPHLGVIPLPFVGHVNADGLIRGFALSLPYGADPAADVALIQALGAWERAPSRLTDGERQVEIGDRHGHRLVAERVVDEADALATLRRSRWSGPARRWATVTPIALDGECDRFNDPSPSVRAKAMRTAHKLVLRAVQRSLGATVDPAEIVVELRFDPPVVGAAALDDVPRYRRAGHARPRQLIHAVITLPQPIQGPLVVGAGRHLGLGLCMPLPDPRAAATPRKEPR
jgi:CRISPR-associated protein Csb2